MSAVKGVSVAIHTSREAEAVLIRVSLLEEWYAITSSVGRETNYADNGETALHFDYSTAATLQRIYDALTPRVVERAA